MHEDELALKKRTCSRIKSTGGLCFSVNVWRCEEIYTVCKRSLSVFCHLTLLKSNKKDAALEVSWQNYKRYDKKHGT